MIVKVNSPFGSIAFLRSLPKILVELVLSCWGCIQASASGFGLYEASSKTYALGGAVLGKAVDASANFHNPATLSDLANPTITVGAMTEHPRCRIKVDGHPSETMDSGIFILPHFQVAVPLPWDFTLGLGVMPEYGLGTEYSNAWTLAGSSEETTVTSFTANPNLAYRVTDRWSVAAGLRFLYFDFEQYSSPLASGMMHHRLKGDNGMRDMGYQIGTKYDITDTFSVGLVYKSQTLVHVDGKSEKDGSSVRDRFSRDWAMTDLTLPQSVTGGFNWDIVDACHLGGMVAWTQWSTIGTLDFNLGGSHTPCVLNWDDTWRIALAASYDFTDGIQGLLSYVYETDCCGDQESTMLPAAERHMVSAGCSWAIMDWLELGVTYGVIIMDGKDTHSYGYKTDSRLHSYRAYRGLSHAAGLSLTFRF